MAYTGLAAPHNTRRRRKQARPDELIDAALALFVERGFAATRAEDVARRAGVSKGTLYLYFSSKDELLRAVIRERVSTRIEATAKQLEAYDGSSVDLLLEMASQWWLDVLESPASGVFKIIVTEVRGFPELGAFWHSEVIEPGERLLGQVLERGIRRGEFRRVDVASAVHSLVLPFVMLCIHRHTLGACGKRRDRLEPRRFIVEHLRLVLQGMLAKPHVATSAEIAGQDRRGRAGEASRQEESSGS
ncbi:MAG TPA: TetR/AcrR family transcriptional regulator [Burkholderiaceae bacterium]